MPETHRDEIEKLEALYASNPAGRVFTHLAEAYRKAGELDRAREILDGGLDRHPDYPSAYVVLGRVLVDGGKADEAAAAFRRVLELDRHNLVALRALGDLAVEAGRFEEARHYFGELILIDPSDLETAERLETLPDEPSFTDIPPEPEVEAVEEPEAEAAAPAYEPVWPPVATPEPEAAWPEPADVEPEAEEAPAEPAPPREPAPLDAWVETLNVLDTDEELPDLPPMDTEPPMSWPEPAAEPEVEPSGVEMPAADGGLEPVHEESWLETAAGGFGEAAEAGEEESAGAGSAGEAFAGRVADTPEPEPEAEPDLTLEPEFTVEPEPEAQPDLILEPEFTVEPELVAEAGEVPEPEALEIEADTLEIEAEVVDEPVAAVSDAIIEPESEAEEAGPPGEPTVAEEDLASAWWGDPEIHGSVPEPVEWVSQADWEQIAAYGTWSGTGEAEESVEAVPPVEEDWGSERDEDADEVATETLAEVYAAQGFKSEAVEIYRKLLRRRPDDERLLSRLAALEKEPVEAAAGEEVNVEAPEGEIWLEEVESWPGGEEPAAAGPTPYAWMETGGPADAEEGGTIGDHLRGILGWQPTVAPDEPAPEPEPEPTLLLEDVAPEPPLPDFPAFGAEASQGGTGPGPRDSESEEDLEMFRSWLKSLRK